MLRLGWVLFVIGVLTLLGAFAMPVSLQTFTQDGYVSDGVANMDLIAQRGMVQIAGLGFLLAGAVFVAAGRIVVELRRKADR